MKKNTIIYIVIVIIVAIGLGSYYVMSRSHTATTSAPQSANTVTQTQAMPQAQKSISDFFSMTGSQQCTFSNKSNANAGTVYIGDGKMRGDFTASANGVTQQTHMVNDGTYVYIWTDGQPKGYKMSLAVMKSYESQASQSQNSAQPSQPVNMSEKVNTSCSPWSVDGSKFTVPTNVTFTDYSAMMQGMGATGSTTGQTGTVGGGRQACSACNQVPAGAARNQCMVALKC